MQNPDVSGFASQWNIGLRVIQLNSLHYTSPIAHGPVQMGLLFTSISESGWVMWPVFP